MESTQLLSNQEMREHQEDEAIIERGLKSFYEVGSALLRIRERRSYRDKFKTFEEYCRVRWDLTPRKSQQFRLSAGVVDDLKAKNFSCLPVAESHTAPLQPLDRGQRQEAWKRALDVADREGRKVTVKLVQEAFYQVGIMLADLKKDFFMLPSEDRKKAGGWEGHCRKEFGWSKSYVCKLTQATVAFQNLKSLPHVNVFPADEGPIVRLITPLNSDPETQAKIWNAAVDSCGGNVPTHP